jgi:hypothetical protein
VELPRPKSTAPDAGSGVGERDGLEAIAQYGRGEYDELTGTYEWYDVPPDVSAERTAADWGEIFARLDLLAFDMQRHLGLRLTTVLRTHTWREFVALVQGLLGLDDHVVTAAGIHTFPASLIGAHFHTTSDDDGEEPSDD